MPSPERHTEKPITKRKPVGLLFAGATFLNANFTFANPINLVLDGLAAELGAFVTLTIDGE